MTRIRGIIFITAFFCTAFKRPNANSYGILLDKKEVYTSWGHEKEAYSLSASEAALSDSVFVRAYLCGSQWENERTALIIKNEKGEETAKYLNNGKLNMSFAAGMPTRDLVNILSEEKTVSLYLKVFSYGGGSNNPAFFIAQVKLGT